MRWRIYATATLLFFGLGLFAFAPDRLGAHQATPSTACISGVTVEPLGVGQPTAADGQELKLLRVTFAPGGSIGMHTHPGALILSIESGALAYAMHDGDVEIHHPPVDGTPVPTDLLTAGSEAILETGDWLFEEGMMHTARNAGDDPAVVLIAGLMRTGEPFTQCVEDAS